jgi:GT2 family glycosyltransferase
MPEVTEKARAAIVAVPRERFSMAIASIESVLADTTLPYDLVYVDGGSPRRVRRRVEQLSTEHGFEVIRRDRYLSPNEARNLGLAAVSPETEYVVFIDNDVLVKPGWLDELVKCADETDAAVVGPLTCEGDFDTVHFAGGEVEILEEAEDADLVRRVRDKMYFPHRVLAGVEDQLERSPCELCEFHCVLVRRSVFDQIGLLDEGMLNTREHLDFCLTVARAGQSVWFEPSSVVAYVPPPPLALSDVGFFMVRWSDDWERRSLEHFRSKWDLTEDEFFRARYQRLGWRRQKTIARQVAKRLTFGHGSWKVEQAVKKVERPLHRLVTSRHARRRDEAAHEQSVSVAA